MESYEDIVRQLEEVRARRKEETARRLEAEKRAEQERREKEEAQARLVQSEARLAKLFELKRANAPTPFLDYVRHAEEQLYSTFYVEQDSSEVSGTVTRVDGNFYPRFLRPWETFAADHAETFNKLATAFGDQALFPSLVDVKAVSREMSFEEDLTDWEDFDHFICTAIEKPAARIASRYLADCLSHPTIASVKIRENARGALRVLGEVELPSPATSRRGYTLNRDNSRTPVLVGELNPLRTLTAEKLRRVMSMDPGDDFFSRVMPFYDVLARRSTAQEMVPLHDQLLVAHALCQAYNSMVVSGLGFGYIAFGDGLIFLRVREDEPFTLYYFYSAFPVPAIPDPVARREANRGARMPQETALAHVVSLCVWAARSTPQPASWSRHVQQLAKPWPYPYEETPSSPAPASIGPFVVEPPTLPYCTQACLLGLCRGLALDDKCPNAALHRAARRCHNAALSPRLKCNKRGGAPQTKPSQKQELSVPDEHPLTASELEALVVAQVAANVDKDIECLDKYGFYGRYGTLFKITVTGYGYTFVAKGVQAAHVGLICGEAAVYDMLAGFQGRLIPVCLGLIEVEPIPLHTCAQVAHLLLLSYVGPDLASPKKDLPLDVDLEQEEERTTAELEAAGLWNDDVREPNLAWNAEVQRVMQFDFDQAYVQEVAPADRPADRPTPVSTGTRSPLVDRRDTNAHRGSDQGKDAGPPAKRVRTAGEEQQGARV